VCSTALLLLYERERAVWLESVCLFHLSVPLLLALGPGTFSLFLPFFLYIHNTTSHIYTQRDRKEKSSISRSLHSFFFFFSVFFFGPLLHSPFRSIGCWRVNDATQSDFSSKSIAVKFPGVSFSLHHPARTILDVPYTQSASQHINSAGLII
jgi:hypothetical protein